MSTFALLGERDLTGSSSSGAASLRPAAARRWRPSASFAVLGNLFGILTVFQLLELANPSQPLLRRLLVETPGTYHHSLMVGNLAERAAEAIGADPLLTRVAAYYHDIGKLANPLAFIENQAGGDNIHDELTPEVVGPDPEGPRRRRDRHGLPGAAAEGAHRVHPAAPRHGAHELLLRQGARGGRRSRSAASSTPEGAKAADGGRQRRFRHAGPKPQSREAALIMLADGVEASVRSLSSRDEPAIRAMVARIIDERLEDGQFDECDLTLRDIERIREAFVGAAPRDVPPADRVPAEQGRRARVAARRRRASGGAAARERRSATWRPVADRRPDGPRRTSARRPIAGRDAAGARRSPRRSRRPAPRAGVARADPRRRPELAALNATHMGKTGPTDVLSFPLLPPEAFPRTPGRRRGASPGRPLAPRVRAAARARPTSATSSCRWSARSSRPTGRGGQTGDVRWSPADELRLLVTHGALHICGWDHADPVEGAAMRRPRSGAAHGLRAERRSSAPDPERRSRVANSSMVSTTRMTSSGPVPRWPLVARARGSSRRPPGPRGRRRR